MENEISQIKSKSLSQGKILSYSIEDELFQINAFKECSIKSNKNKKVYISSSGEVSPFQFDCIIGNKMWTFYMNRLGKVEVYETK